MKNKIALLYKIFAANAATRPEILVAVGLSGGRKRKILRPVGQFCGQFCGQSAASTSPHFKNPGRNWPHYWPQKSGIGRKKKFLRPAGSLGAVGLKGYWPQRTQNL
ncbi:hypothetical protein [Neomoorella thermoacetica]|uniref:hypothetical protein n=1 Tax=Neomoorella thermoacetica TaxID=1525 RepID=UPI00117DD920|nr:hypothetical protein [Moorella thermoacetica]